MSSKHPADYHRNDGHSQRSAAVLWAVFLRPFGAGSFRPWPTAYAVGFILAPLRG